MPRPKNAITVTNETLVTRYISRAPEVFLIEKQVLYDIRLSWEARGILIFMLSLAPGERVSVQEIARWSGNTDSVDGLNAVIKNLFDVGYVNRDGDSGALSVRETHS